MNKPLLIFLISGLLIILASVTYMKYCKSQSIECKFEKFDVSDFGPKEGIDW